MATTLSPTRMPIAGPHQAGGLDPELANRCAAWLMSGTVCFNAMLAVFNGHVALINNGLVALTQAALVIISIAVAVLARPDGIGRPIALAWVLVLLNFALMLGRSALDIKSIGDALVLPTFLALGLCMRRQTLFTTLIWLQVVLVVAVIWELFFPTSFGNFFMVRDYYSSTRGFSKEVFWAGDDNLFLSSMRPGGRILSFGLDINRGSSLFLEPVTLGNWTVVVTIALVTFWKSVSVRDRWILLVTNFLLLVGCDGRLALATNILLLLTMGFSTRLPRFIPPLYLPGLFLLLATLMAVGLLDIPVDGYDTNTGRYAFGTMLLQNLSLTELFGMVPTPDMVHADSGWTYISLKQSLFGLAILWLAITLAVPGSEKGRRFSHAAGLFVALGLPVSYSIVSIKMAATLWVVAGVASREVLAERRGLTPS